MIYSSNRSTIPINDFYFIVVESENGFHLCLKIFSLNCYIKLPEIFQVLSNKFLNKDP